MGLSWLRTIWWTVQMNLWYHKRTWATYQILKNKIFTARTVDLTFFKSETDWIAFKYEYWVSEAAISFVEYFCYSTSVSNLQSLGIIMKPSPQLFGHHTQKRMRHSYSWTDRAASYSSSHRHWAFLLVPWYARDISLKPRSSGPHGPNNSKYLCLVGLITANEGAPVTRRKSGDWRDACVGVSRRDLVL